MLSNLAEKSILLTNFMKHSKCQISSKYVPEVVY